MKTIALTAALLFAAPTAWANNLSGKWSLPGGGHARIQQNGDGLTKVVAKVKNGKKSYRLVLKGRVAYVKVGSDGGLGLDAKARSFPIRWEGKRCEVRNPRLAALGSLSDGSRGREYRTRGWLRGSIYCGGQNTWRTWLVDLSGTWK